MFKNMYIGLDDTNGKGIHEGDKLYFKVFDGLAELEGEATVYFSQGCFRLNEIHPVIDYIKNGYVEVVS